MSKNNIKAIQLAPGESAEITIKGGPAKKPKKLSKGAYSFTEEAELGDKLSPSTFLFYHRLRLLMSKGNHIYLGREDLATHYNLSSVRVNKHFQELLDNDVIRGSARHHMINPYYSLNGGIAYLDGTKAAYNCIRKNRNNRGFGDN